MAGVWDLYIATTHSSIFCRCFYCRLAPKSTDKFSNALFFKSAIFRNSVRMNHGTKVALSLLSCPPPLSYGVTLVAQPSYYGRRARPPHHTKRDNNSPFHSSMMKISPVLIMSISKCLSLHSQTLNVSTCDLLSSPILLLDSTDTDDRPFRTWNDGRTAFDCGTCTGSASIQAEERINVLLISTFISVCRIGIPRAGSYSVISNSFNYVYSEPNGNYDAAFFYTLVRSCI